MNGCLLAPSVLTAIIIVQVVVDSMAIKGTIIVSVALTAIQPYHMVVQGLVCL